MTRLFIQLSIGAVLLAWSSSLQAQRLVDHIEVRGNTKAKTEIILELSQLQRYQEITQKLIQDTRRKIESSELFEDVSVKLTDPSNGNPGHYANVLIIVKEKISWFAAPIFSVSSKNISGGIVYGESNLLGYNKKLIWVIQYGDKLKQLFSLYRDPSLFASNFTMQLSAIARQDLHEEWEDRKLARRIEVSDFGGVLLPGYRWDPYFTTSMGIDWRHFYYGKPSIYSSSEPRTRIFENVRNIALRIEFKYNRMTSHYGLLEGSDISLTSEISDERFWSETNYFLEELNIQASQNVFRRHNVSFKLNGALGTTLPYHKDMMAGGTNLRGYLYREFRGDTMLRTNLEYLIPLFEVWKLVFRMITFWDSGLVFFKQQGVNRDNWRNGVGGGLRLYLKNIVVPLMGFDAGYAIEQQTYALYFNIGTLF